MDRGETDGKDILCYAMFGVNASMLYADLIVFPMFSESFRTHHYMPLWGTTSSICQERRTALKRMVWLETKHKINKKPTNHNWFNMIK